MEGRQRHDKSFLFIYRVNRFEFNLLFHQVFAHGDYYRGPNPYVTKHVDFTTEQGKLVDFVKDVELTCTNGGDWEECYELVLREARTKLSWAPGMHCISMSSYRLMNKEGTTLTWHNCYNFSQENSHTLITYNIHVAHVQYRYSVIFSSA